MKKKLIIYGIGTVLSKILVFLMVPIYTRIFSAADYGYYDVILSDIQMLISISFIEIWSGILRFMFASERKETPIKAFIKIAPFTLVMYLVFLFVLSFFISLKYPFLLFLYGILYLLYTISNTVCRGYERNKDYVLSGIIYTIVSCVFGIIFSLYLKLGIRGVIISQCIGYLIPIIFVEWRTGAYRNALACPALHKDIKDLLLYSFPLMLNSFSFLFLGTYNKNIILRVLGEEQSGLYAFALKFSAIFSILISIFSMAWQEEAFSNESNENKERIYSYYINRFFRFIGLAVPIFVIFSYFASTLVGGSNFNSAKNYLLLSISAAFFAEVSGVYSILIAVNKQTTQTLLSTIAGAIVNISILHLFIKGYGVNGPNIALNIGFIVAATIRYIFVRRSLKINFEISWLLLYIIEMMILIFSLNRGEILVLVYGFLFIIIWIIVNWKDVISLCKEAYKMLNGVRGTK